MALSKSRPTLQTLDDRIVPDATPLPNLPDGTFSGPATGQASYSTPSTGLGSYDYGSYGNNSYTAPSGTASYDYGSSGNNSYTAPSTGLASYDSASASVSGSGSYSLLFDSGSGSGSSGNNSYTSPSSGTASYDYGSTGNNAYTAPSGGASYDSGSTGNNSYTSPSTGTASYDSGLFGNNSYTGVGSSGVGDPLTGIGTGPFGYTSTGNNSYVLTASDGGTWSYSLPLFGGGSGTTEYNVSYSNNSYTSPATAIGSDIPPPAGTNIPNGIITPVAPVTTVVPDPSIADLKAKIAANKVKITENSDESGRLDCLISDAQDRARELGNERRALTLAFYVAAAEVQRLEAAGDNGCDYAKALETMRLANGAIFEKFAAESAASREANGLLRQKEELLKENSKLETENTESQQEIDRLNAKAPNS